jgi:hypothetical protein
MQEGLSMGMPRKTLTFAAWFALSVLSVLGQSPAPLPSGHPALGPTLPRDFIDIPAVAGAPFTATAVVELERYNVEDEDPFSRTLSLIARDSKGRTHNEVRRLMPQSFHGTPPVLVVRIFDPETHTEITYDPARHTGRRTILADQPQPFFVSNAEVKTEDMGTSMMNGLKTKGTHRTYTLPKHGFGWGKPPQREEEDWTSEELHLSLLVKYVDEHTGALTIGISSLKRQEPSASMFEVPAGYRIEDLTGGGGAPGAPEGAGQSSKP